MNINPNNQSPPAAAPNSLAERQPKSHRGQQVVAEKKPLPPPSTNGTTNGRQKLTFRLYESQESGQPRLLASRQNMSSIISERNRLARQRDSKRLYIVDADGSPLMIIRDGGKLILVPDCDMFEDEGQPAKESNRTSGSNPVICGVGTFQGEIRFHVRLTDTGYTAEQVAQLLESGDVYMSFGDGTLYDEDKCKAIGQIEWGDDRGDFVPTRVVVSPDQP